MLKRTFIAATALAAVWVAPVAAADYVTLGRLVCGSDGNVGMIITSEKLLEMHLHLGGWRTGSGV